LSVQRRRRALSLLIPLLAGAAVVEGQDVQRPPAQFRFHYSTDGRSALEKIRDYVFGTGTRSIALIAGISLYPKLGPADRTLPPAAADVDKLSAYLRDKEYFDEIWVLRDESVNEDNLKYFLQTYLPARVKAYPKSRVLFAYSGHGVTTETGGYLLKSSAVSFTDTEHSIPLQVLRAYVDLVVGSAHQVLVLLNACYSGSFVRVPFGDQLPLGFVEPGAHAITAGGTQEKAWHDGRLGSGSIFFEKVLTGIAGDADGTRDGFVTSDELGAYLRTNVPSIDPRQHPLIDSIRPKGSPGAFFFYTGKRAALQTQASRPQGRGTAFGEPAGGASAAGPDPSFQTQALSDPTPEIQGWTDARGSFRAEVGSGRYRVRFIKIGFVDVEYYNVRAGARLNPVMRAGGSLETLMIQSPVSESGSDIVSGTVRDERGVELPGILVAFWKE